MINLFQSSLFKKDRIANTFEYMKKIAGVDAAALKVAQDKAEFVAKNQFDVINDALKIPGGEETKGWRYAVRSYVLLKIITDYSGGESLKDFAAARKLEVNSSAESTLQRTILTLLTKVSETKVLIADNVYLDAKTDEKLAANIFHPLPPPGYRLWVPKGNWKLVDFNSWSNKFDEVQFGYKSQTYDGIYSTGAGDCDIAAFVYGVKGNITSIQLIHISGGHASQIPDDEWKRVCKDELLAVILNTRSQPKGPTNYTDFESIHSTSVCNFWNCLKSHGINEKLLLIHYAKTDNHSPDKFGINKWGGFGATNN
jgi:hypothetical protein